MGTKNRAWVWKGKEKLASTAEREKKLSQRNFSSWIYYLSCWTCLGEKIEIEKWVRKRKFWEGRSGESELNLELSLIFNGLQNFKLSLVFNPLIDNTWRATNYKNLKKLNHNEEQNLSLKIKKMTKFILSALPRSSQFSPLPIVILFYYIIIFRSSSSLSFHSQNIFRCCHSPTVR